MKGLLTDKTRILHILEAIGEIEQYLTGVSYNDFLTNSEKRFATIKQIEIVGEACNNLTAEFKDAHPEIAWTDQRLQKYFNSRIFCRQLSNSMGNSPK